MIIFICLVIIYWKCILIFIILTTYSFCSLTYVIEMILWHKLKKKKKLSGQLLLWEGRFIWEKCYAKNFLLLTKIFLAYVHTEGNRFYSEHLSIKKGVIQEERKRGDYLGLHFCLRQQSMESMTWLKGNLWGQKI